MPAYNAEKYIGEAIESILNQTYKNFEFIIIDDASTDDTLKIINKYARRDKRIVVIKNKTNLMISKSLNKGIKRAKGKYIVRFDADDWSFPYRIEKQVDFMESNPNVVISGGAMMVCNENLDPVSIRKYPAGDQELRKIFMRYSPFSHPAVIYHTSLAQKIGGYNKLYAEDIEFYLKIGEYGRFGNLDDILIKYREIKSSMTNTKLKTVEINTIKHRLKAIIKYHYGFSIIDMIYNLLHIVSIYIMPAKIKMGLFIKYRDHEYK
jgi:glycosyltransferase involved in cell wall biosynthesis